MQQKKTLLFYVGILAATPCFGSAEVNPRVTYPNAFIVEGGGRALLYSVNYDRVLDEHFSAGIGFGTVGTNLVNAANQTISSSTSVIIPIYFTYYFMNKIGSPFLTFGADIVTNSDNNVQSSVAGVELHSPLLGTIGGGYEVRSDTGFLARATVYGIMAGNFKPWAGISVGYSF